MSGGDVSGILSSGSTSSRGSTTTSVGMLPPLSQCLMLDTITLDDQKGTRSAELKRIFSVAEEGRTMQLKAGSSAAEDVRRFRGSLVETSTKAGDRVKKMQESVYKLDNYRSTYPPKRRGKLTSSGGTNPMAAGNQIQQSSLELVNQRLDKNVGFIKRVRTTVAESEARNIALSRQSVNLDKDRDLLKSTGGGGLVQDEQKIRGMPAGGDGWDKKMKRKRSIGAVGNRAVDGDYEPKRAMHQKPTSDPRSRSLDPHGFGSCPSNGGSGINKFDVTSQLTSSNIRLTPKIELENNSLQNDRKDRGMNKLDATSQLTSSNIRLTPKIELENVSLQNDRRDRGFGFDKERVVPKVNNKLNILESNQVGIHSPVPKGKASRAARTGSGGPSSSPNIPRTPGAHDVSEQPSSLNKVQILGGVNNRKRPMPTAGPPSPPVTQWFGQRPQKNSRTRRANLVSPGSIRDEVQTVSEGFPTSEIGNRLTSSETTSQLPKVVSNRAQQYKMKPENVPSPARFSESEESGAGENKLKDKHVDYGEIEDQSVNEVKKIGSIASSMKNSKAVTKEDLENGPRRQGRSGRGQSVSRVSVPQIRVKMDSPGTTKPGRSMRIGSEKNESKPGRPPSKKFAERKALARPGKALNSGSSGFTGESDDDQEELLAAANSALKASYLACSGSFWKKVEPIFSSVSSENTTYLRQQLRFVEELDELFCDVSGADLNDLGEVGWTEPVSQLNGNRLNISGSSVTQSQEFDTLCGMLDTEGYEKVNPLYQRVLSALIGEDEIDDNDHPSEGQEFLHYASDDSPCITFGSECKDGDMLESDLDSNGELVNSDTGTASVFDENHVGGSPSFSNSSVSAASYSDCQYQLMCLDDKLMLELQSIDLHPERVPDLPEGEDEEIIKEIHELKKGLYQKARKKKVKLSIIDKALLKEREVERREIEQIALNKLVEMAYKRRMACRGGNYSRSGVSRVTKVAALAFVKRTITRCRKFEAAGKSCFSEPALQKIILSASICSNDGELVDTVCTEAGANVPLASGAVSVGVEQHGPYGVKFDRGSNAIQSLGHSFVQTFAQCEPMSNRSKKREVLLEDVGNAGSRAVAPLGEILPGNAKGRRSERDMDQNKDMSTGNCVAKVGRPALGGFRGERKTKTKPKLKLVQLSSSGNGLFDKVRETADFYRPVRDFHETVTNDRDKVRDEVELHPPSRTHLSSSKVKEEPGVFASLHLSELDPASVSNDLDGPQDLTSWLDFDEDGLQDHDSMGLEIPMDDLSELQMIM